MSKSLSKIAVALMGFDETLFDAFRSIVLDLTNEVTKTREYSDCEYNAIHDGQVDFIGLTHRNDRSVAFDVRFEFDSEIFSVNVPDNLVRFYEAIVQAQRDVVNAALDAKEERQKVLNELSEQYHAAIQVEASRILSEDK